VDGVLNLDKPAGITSFKAVSRVRRAAGGTRAGHAGTLDPFATGILPIMLGSARRVSEFLLDYPKTYLAEITLGVETDTLDITGKVVETADFSHITELQVKEALPRFIGEIRQVPPVYSAIKQDGKRLYQMARDGLSPKPESRVVNIYSLEVVAFSPPFLTIEIACGRGTYIRSLARDLSLAIQSRGHLSKLERTAYGPLKISDSLKLDDIEKPGGQDILLASLLPLDSVLGHLPLIELSDDEAGLVANGGSIFRPDASGESTNWRAYDEDRNLVALLVGGNAPGWYKPRKVFTSNLHP
jgi:tRNA pseudouridine55 synthase